MAKISLRFTITAALLASGLAACAEEKPAAPIADRYIKAVFARDAAGAHAELCAGEQVHLTVEKLQERYANPFTGAILSQSHVVAQASELYHENEGYVMFDVEVPDLDTLWVGYQPTFTQVTLPDGTVRNVMEDPLPAGAARIAAGKLSVKQTRESVHLRRDAERGWCVIDERTRLGLYEESRQLAAAGDYEGAIARLEEVRSLDPKARLLDDQVAKLRAKAAEVAARPPVTPSDSAGPDGSTAAPAAPVDPSAAAPADGAAPSTP